MNRRQLAGASCAALVIGLAGATKAAELDGELLARQRAADAAVMLEERRGPYARASRDSIAGVASQAEMMAAEVARIPARTPEGAKAKARALVWLHGGDDTAQAG